MPEKDQQPVTRDKVLKRQQVKADTMGSNYKESLKRFVVDAKKSGGVDRRLFKLMGIDGKGKKPEDRLLRRWRL